MGEDEKVQNINELFGGNLVEIEDTGSIDFDKPIKGAYRARIVSLKRYSGESDKCENGVYDMWSLNMQVEDTLEGEFGDGRYLSKTYSNVVGKYQENADEGCQRLANDLFTSGIIQKCTITKKVKMEIIEEIAGQIIDKLVNVRAYSRKNKQVCRIVNEFKGLNTNTVSPDDTAW